MKQCGLGHPRVMDKTNHDELNKPTSLASQINITTLQALVLS
jgi:hypothetical protein